MSVRCFISSIIFLFMTCNVNAYWANTHARIAKESLAVGNSLLDSRVNDIGLTNGLSEKSNGYTLDQWVGVGSVKEDDSPRYKNHFYNPLDGSGLADVATGSSSYEWADQINSGWSWRNSRLSFYRGMTAPSDVERRSALADSFRALGQVMHLVQDTAVPAHVRNDLHLIPDGFEVYASENVNSLNFVPIAFSGPKNSISTYSPRQLWDSDQYDGTNPKTSAAIGLAEYTNANFASEDTIFTENYLDDWNQLNNEHYFPYPRQADMVVVDERQNRIGMNGYVIYRKYFEKIGGGEIIRHFATASRLYEHLLDDPEPSIQGFDDQCYKDYANLLIPRAVGYSAALLDYFFRGQIDMTADSGQYVIKNESDEAMSGTFSLYYDDKYDMRKLVPAAEWNLSISAKGASSPVTFAAPSDAKEPGKYILVFMGTHGAESGAVVGKSIELKNDLDIRIVTVSNYVSEWEDHRGEIKVFTNTGVITGKIPNGKYVGKTIKVRFDVGNPNIIGILVRVVENGHEYFKIYRYKIDENNNSLIYEKTIFEHVEQIYEKSSSLFHEEEDKYSPTEKSIWRWTIDFSSFTYYNVIDFYLNGEEIKPFYSKNTDNFEELHFTQCYYYGNDLKCHGRYDDTIEIGYRNESTEIFYDNNKIASANNICSGGGLQANGGYLGCKNEYNVYMSVEPVSIFNKNDFVYLTTQHRGNYWNNLSSITTSLPLDLAKYIINSSSLSSDLANGKVRLNSHLLKGDSYSFNLSQNWTDISFSSSLGVLECGGMLVTDRQMDGGYLALRGFDSGVLKSCDDFKKINTLSYSINAQEVADFYVK